MKPVLRSVLEAIGETPLVELSRFVAARKLDGRILAKLEYLNPGFSKKDRIALQIIDDAERSGELKPGQTVVELTSGNTGTGLSIVCGVRGYPFVAVMSKGNSMERARMMAALGAEVVLVDQAPGSMVGQVSGDDLALVELRAQELVRERNAFRADQFRNRGNIRAHELHTGEEIWEQSGGTVDAFADFAGTAGSFVGCANALRRHRPGMPCWLVEPEGAPYLAAGRVSNPNHRIQGGGYSMDLPFLDGREVTGFLTVSDEEAMRTARDLARLEGIFGGFSGGANVAAAARLLEGPARGKTVAVLICDSGLKYMSTDLY
jgi:cysteine synthase A